MNFVFSRKAQEAVKKMTQWQKFKIVVLGMRIYLGHERHEGWSAANPFYLFWCYACGKYSKDYPHSSLAVPRLDCCYCGAARYFIDRRVLRKMQRAGKDGYYKIESTIGFDKDAQKDNELPRS